MSEHDLEAGFDAEKVPGDEVPSHHRTGVAFEEHETGKIRHAPTGIEMRREITKEERDLAAAGYDELEASKKAKVDREGLDKVDISEHRLPSAKLAEALDSDIDFKNPASSNGLSESEAKIRLDRDGKNVLTPPKKKSALERVKTFPMAAVTILTMCSFLTVLGMSVESIQHHSNRVGCP